MKRPPPAVRVGIVVAAVALLGLAMCNRSKPPATTTPPDPTTQQQQAPQTAPADAAPALEEGKMGKEPPRHFPATKAPGKLY
jgi:hypothetical protein